MKHIKIESGVPIPKVNTGAKKGSGLIAMLESMAINDSILIERKRVSYVLNTGKKLGFKMTSRKVDDNNYRIWRVDPGAPAV